MFRILSIRELLRIGLGVPSEPSEKTPMAPYGFQIQLVRVVIDLVEGIRMGLPPAVSAAKIASIDVGGHLHAPMALYAVECAFVARPVCDQALLRPVASLHSTMLSHELVLLLRKACGYHRVYLCHGTLQALTPDSESRRGAVSEGHACGQHVLKLTRSTQSIYEPLTSVADEADNRDTVCPGLHFGHIPGVPIL